MKGKRTTAETVLKIIQILLTAALLGTLILAIINIREGDGERGREQLEASVRRSAVVCYTIEGVYPENLEYLREHYGLQIDNDRYTVHYSVFAENLMPDITVLEKSK